jgi:hypothetical protein
MKKSLLLFLVIFSSNIFSQDQKIKWWQPKVGSSWAIQFSGLPIIIVPQAEIQNIDLYDTEKSFIDYLHLNGKKVICYFSAGSFENWRIDSHLFPSEILGNNLDGWPGEKWLDIRRLDILKPIMTSRLDLAVIKNCDGIDVDNLDGYTQKSGFNLSYEDQIIYNKMLAHESHSRGLGIGLKNDLNQIKDLVDDYDWAINEECFEFKECELLAPFIKKSKPVFNIEYKGKNSTFCPKANELNFSSLKKKLNLDSWFESCKDYTKN